LVIPAWIARQHLFFTPSDRKAPSPRSEDFAGHGGIAADLPSPSKATSATGTFRKLPQLGPSLGWPRPGNMNMDVGTSATRPGRSEFGGARLDQCVSAALRAFLHHVAQLAREDQLASAGMLRRLGQQNIAAAGVRRDRSQTPDTLVRMAIFLSKRFGPSMA